MLQVTIFICQIWMQTGQKIIKIRDRWLNRARQNDGGKNEVSLGNQDHKDNSEMERLDSRIFSFHIFFMTVYTFPEVPLLIAFPLPIRLVLLKSAPPDFLETELQCKK